MCVCLFIYLSCWGLESSVECVRIRAEDVVVWFGLFDVYVTFFSDFRHNITIQLTPSRAELNRLQVQMQNGL